MGILGLVIVAAIAAATLCLACTGTDGKTNERNPSPAFDRYLVYEMQGRVIDALIGIQPPLAGSYEADFDGLFGSGVRGMGDYGCEHTVYDENGEPVKIAVMNLVRVPDAQDGTLRIDLDPDEWTAYEGVGYYENAVLHYQPGFESVLEAHPLVSFQIGKDGVKTLSYEIAGGVVQEKELNKAVLETSEMEKRIVEETASVEEDHSYSRDVSYRIIDDGQGLYEKVRFFDDEGRLRSEYRIHGK